MAIQLTSFSVILLIAVLVNLGQAVYLHFYQRNPVATILKYGILFASEWTFAYWVESVSTSIPIKIWFSKISYIGIYGCVPLFLIFIVYFLGQHSRLSWARVAILFLVPAIMNILVQTNDMHLLIWSGYTYDEGINLIIYHPGPLYWLGVIYNYALFTLIIILLVNQAVQTKGLFRAQAQTLLIGPLPLILANFTYLFKIPALRGMDFSPIGLGLMGLIFMLGVRKHRLFSLQPVPRDVILDGIQDGVIVLDEKQILVDCNPAAEKHLLLPLDKAVGKMAEEALIMQADLQSALQSGTNFQLEYKEEGLESRDICVTGKRITTQPNHPGGWLITFHDITDRKQIEQQEKEQRLLAEALRDVTVALTSTLEFDKVLDRIIENIHKVMPHGMTNIILIDDQGIGRVVRYMGYENQELLRWVKEIRFDVKNVSNMKWMIDNRKPMIITDTHQAEFWVRKDDHARSYLGAPVQIQGRTFGFINQDHMEPNFYTPEMADRLQTFADLAAIALENARLFKLTQEMAVVDELTGMNNRRYFVQMATNEIKRSHRYGKVCSLVMFDLDHFKDINDQYGHAAGDKALKAAAQIINDCIREIDISSRYGGDEFCVLLPETDQAGAAVITDRLAQSFRAYSLASEIGVDRRLTASFGIAILDGHSVTLDDLLLRADQALYTAKQNGRDRYEVWKPQVH